MVRGPGMHEEVRSRVAWVRCHDHGGPKTTEVAGHDSSSVAENGPGCFPRGFSNEEAGGRCANVRVQRTHDTVHAGVSRQLSRGISKRQLQNTIGAARSEVDARSD